MFEYRHACSTVQNQRESLFLRLPGEVRNRIYKYVFGGKQISILRPRVYSIDKSPIQDFKSSTCVVRKLLYLGETCRQMRAETELFLFELNEFRIAGGHNFKYFIQSVSQRQLEAIKTYIWPRKSQLVADGVLSKFAGLERIIVQKGTFGGDDFYIPGELASPSVHHWYEENRVSAQKRLEAWEAKGVAIEYSSSD